MRIDDPLELFELLHDLGADVWLDHDGRLRIDAGIQAPNFVRDLARTNRDWLVILLRGAELGHHWLRCDRCGEGVMTAVKTRRCSVTFRCGGRLGGGALPPGGGQ
jgi:hypothetical protein